MVGAHGLALCLGLLLVAGTASGRKLKQETEQPVVGVVAPVVGAVPLAAPGTEGALLLTGPPILVAGTITVPATEPSGRETSTTGRGLKQESESGESYAPASEGRGESGRKLMQAGVAPTAVAVLGAPTAESLLGSGGSGGRRLQQGGESVAAQLLAPITESLPGTGRRLQRESTIAERVAPYTESLPNVGRRLQQPAGAVSAGDVGGGLGVERTIPAPESIGPEQQSTTGRRLQQGGESLAAQLLAPIAESLPGTGRRLQQGGSAQNVVTAVGGPAAPLSENLAQSASIGRRLQQEFESGESYAPASEGRGESGRKLMQTGLASAEPAAVAQRAVPAIESAVESALTGRRLAQTQTGATPTEAVTPGTAAAPTPILSLPGVVSTPSAETSGRRLMQTVTTTTALPAVFAPVAELPGPVGRRLQQVSSGAGSEPDLSAVGSVGHGQLPAPTPAPSSEGK